MNNFRDAGYGIDIRAHMENEIEICQLCRHRYLKSGGCANPDCDNYIRTARPQPTQRRRPRF